MAKPLADPVLGSTPSPTANESGQQPVAPAGVVTSSSNGAVSNSAAANENGVQTNQFGVSRNGFGSATNGLTPTSEPGFTNRIMATNNFGLTNSVGSLLRDQAITSADRQLLAQLRAAVFGANAPSEQLATASVHFILANGVVRLVGEVP